MDGICYRDELVGYTVPTGFVIRMSGLGTPTCVLDYKPERRRGVGRPKIQWVSGVIEDLRKFDVKNLCKVAKDVSKNCLNW